MLRHHHPALRRSTASQRDWESGQFSVALLSQPSDDVSLTLEELKSEINGTSVKRWAPQKMKNSAKLNFTSDNWFIAQTVSVTAYDDHIIEDTSSSGDLVTYNSNGKPVDINGAKITNQIYY